MKQIETEIIISTKPEKVWAVLTDFENYPNWNPFIRSIRGEKKTGKKIMVSIKPPDGTGMSFSPVILNFEPISEFRWKGKSGIKGFFDGEHYFKLIDLFNGHTKFIHGEIFSGILVPLLSKVLNKTKDGFELMNKALKEKCETG